MTLTFKIKHNISYKKILYFTILLYFMGLMAHNKGFGFDAIFCRLTFVLMIAVELIRGYKNKTAKVSGAFLKYFAFVVLYYISLIWATNRSDVFYITILSAFIQILGVSFVLCDIISCKHDYEIILKIIMGSVLYMIILLVIQTPLYSWGSERVGSVMKLNPNDIGMRAAIALVISLYFAQRQKKFYILSLIFSAIAFLTGSRKAFAMVILGTTAYYIGKDRGLKTALNIILAILLGYAAFYIVFNVPVLYDLLGRRIESAIAPTIGIRSVVRDHSSIERQFFRETAIKMWLDRPILGYGGNNFVSHMRDIGYSHVAYSHCNFTELLATLGISGFGLFYIPIVSYLIKLVNRFKDHHDTLTLLFVIIMILILSADLYCVSYYDILSMVLIILAGNYSTLKITDNV